MSASAMIREIGNDQEDVEQYSAAQGQAPDNDAEEVGEVEQELVDDEELDSDDREYVGDVTEEELEAAQQNYQPAMTPADMQKMLAMMARASHDEELDSEEDADIEQEELDEEGPGPSGGAPGASEEPAAGPRGGAGMYMTDEQQQMLQMLMQAGGGGPMMMGGMQDQFQRAIAQQEAMRSQAGSSAPTAAAAPPRSEWKGLSSLPEATQQAYFQALQQLLGAGRRQLTVLLLGCSGAGKSATVNSVLGETAIDLKPLMDTPPRVTAAVRSAQGVTLKLLDTPPLTDGDKVSQRTLDAIASLCRTEGQIDVVLYVDRLDGERVGPLTKQVLSAVTDTLGKDVWQHTILALTRAESLPVTGGLSAYEGYCDRRAAALRRAMYDSGAPKSAVIPLVLIDNRSGCPKDASQQKVLPDGRCWLPMMVHELVQLAVDNEGPFVYNPKQRGSNNPNRRFKWLIPLVIIAQYLFKVYVMDRILDEDSITGDAYGPYSAEYVEDERARRKDEAAAAKRAAARKAAKAEAKKAPKPVKVVDEDDLLVEDSSSSSESDDDDDDVDSDGE